jgi:hypothetical protein
MKLGNRTFRKLDLFPSLVEQIEALTLFGPFERGNLGPMIEVSFF